MKHTPGPWRLEEWGSDYGPTGDFSVYPCGAKNKYPIASVQEPFHRSKTKANAMLIAAAPELLEALIEMLEYAGIIEERFDRLATDRARAAIAKATGAAA